MPEIGRGLVARGNGKVLGHGAVTEARELRENEPHPVTLLSTLAQFRENTLIDWRLRVDKALQIETIGHDAGLAPDWLTSSASRSRSGRWLSRILR